MATLSSPAQMAAPLRPDLRAVLRCLEPHHPACRTRPPPPTGVLAELAQRGPS